MKHIKNFFHNQFAWYITMAIMSIMLTGCYIFQGEEILAILWAVIAGCDLAIAWLNKDEKV